MNNFKKYFNKEKPNDNQIIGFKAIDEPFPEIGIYQSFENGDEQVYIPANGDVEYIKNIDYWFKVPQNQTRIK